MHTYESAHGRLPPAVVYGKDGRPLYSWRVLILPYLEQNDLYKRFRLDEPWDSPHNLSLVEQMPSLYALPPRKSGGIPPHHTICHVFVGEGTAFEDREGQRLRDFSDSTSSTLLIIEAGEPVPWTKPEELPYADSRPLPPVETPFRDVIRCAFVDGSTRHLKKEIAERTLRALITRNGRDKREALRDLDL